jgi:hypothetical protein
VKDLKIDPKTDVWKVKHGGSLVKVFNSRDWIDRIIDAKTGEVQYFMGLQYCFEQTKQTFYDKSTGTFFIWEIQLRL